MTLDTLKDKALEIADLLFDSEEKWISRADLKNHLPDEFAEFLDLIRNSLCSIEKIVKKKGQSGGIQFAEKSYRRSKLTQNEKATISKKVEQLFKDYIEQNNRPKNDKPEKEVEMAFKNWIENQEKFFANAKFIRFRSEARKAQKWENVDGYALLIETLKYHLSFNPILISFEVKPSLPNIQDINQAKNYLKFSHEVYLIFRNDSNVEKTKEALEKIGFDYAKDGIGIFYTADGINFERIYEAPRTNPAQDKVDAKIEKLFSESDKEELLGYKYEYVIENVIIPAISNK